MRRFCVGCIILLGSLNVLGTQKTDLIKADLFSLRDVRLLGGPLQAQQEQNRLYLNKLDPDRLLSWFFREAGLEPKAPPYRGWESEGMPLAGHILGFYMSGASMTVQSTGDEQLRRRLEYIVDQLEAVQQANQSGYMLAVPNGKNLFAEIAQGHIVIDGLPWNGYKINGVFEPTYTLNKLLLGLYQVYLATGNEKAKQVMLRLADWFGKTIIDKLNDEQLQLLMQCEHGSLPESYVDAYTLSGSETYLAWARRICHERMLAPLAENRGEFLTSFHANSNIPKYTGFQHLYRVTGQERLHAAASHFWDEVVDHRSWVIGGNSANEHFFDPGKFGEAINAPAGPESCNSVNMLRLAEALYQTHPSSRMMDVYERILFNHILSAHDPQRGMFVYYTPMFPGAYRVYSDEFDSMWCCVGTGLEVPGKYARMIYTHSPDNTTLTVNLFAASELAWKARGVTIRQDTEFPYQPRTQLTVQCRVDTDFTLCLRHPSWVSDDRLKIRINGAAADVISTPGSYASIKRTWKTGDVVDVDLPMQLSTENLPGSDSYVAFLYGPVVLSGQLGLTDGLTKDDFWQIGSTTGNKMPSRDSVPVLVSSRPDNLVSHIQPLDEQPLHFRLRDIGRPKDVTLIPFFENHFQRYAIYWQRQNPDVYDEEQKKFQTRQKALAALDLRTVDAVKIGNDASEQEHSFKGLNSHRGNGAYGRRMDVSWRDASDGGWFSYVLAVHNQSPLALHCEFWGREQVARKFDILVDGQRLDTISLTDTGKEDFVSVELKLPETLTQGKTQVAVRFQAYPANTAGGVFDVRMVRSANTDLPSGSQ